MDPNRLLLVRLTAIGDVVHALPAAAALKRHHPGVELHWLVDGRAAEILRGSPVIDKLIVFAGRHVISRPAQTLATLCQLRQMSYSAVFDLQGLLKSAVLARLVRSSAVWGFAPDSLREPLAAAFYDRMIPTHDAPDTHVIAKGLALVGEFLGRDVVREPWEFPLGYDPRFEAEVTAQLPSDKSPVVVLNPGAAWQTKRWPPIRYARVVEGLSRCWPIRKEQPVFVLTWGPGEEPLRDAVQQAVLPTVRLKAFPTTLGHLTPLFRRARLVISGDTGPLQIALAAGAPAVSIFGPTWPTRNGPFRPADLAATAFQRLPCSGCYAKRCPLDPVLPPRCLDLITPDAVIDAAICRLTGNTT